MFPEMSMGVRVVAAAVDPGVGEGAGRRVTRVNERPADRGGDASFLDPSSLGQTTERLFRGQRRRLAGAGRIPHPDPVQEPDSTGPAFTSDWKRNAMKWGNLAGVPLLFVAFGISG